MSYLEDVLKPYGVDAPYWDDGDTEPSDLREQIKTFQADALAASDGWRDEMQLVDLTGRLPMFLQLGDIRSQKNSADTALMAYQAEVLGELDPQRLSELAYLLLQRCRVDELPLCDKDFDGSWINFADENELSGDGTFLISSRMIDFDDAGPEFADKPTLLNLSIRAFGRSYVQCVRQCFTEEGATWEDKWHELVALEGLRASFFAIGNLDGLDALGVSFSGWLEDYTEGIAGLSAKATKGLKDMGHSVAWVGDMWVDPEDHLYEVLNPFVINFNKAGAYVQGWRKAAPSKQSVATLRDIRDLLRSELQPAVGHLRTISDRTEAIHNRMDLIVEKLIDLDQRSDLTWKQVREWPRRISEAEKANARDSLQAALGDVWSKLHPESQEDLIGADLVFAECNRIGSAFRCAALGYGVVAERELKKTVKYFRESKVLAASARKETLGELIGALKNLGAFEVAQVDKLCGDGRLIFEPRQITRLEKLNRISVRAKHPEEPVVSKADVRDMQKLLLRPADNAKPLLAVVVRARDSG